jgi:tape measure domain-containing protein
MAFGINIRDLFVSLGFDIDDKPIKAIDKSIDSLKSNLKGLTIITAAIGGLTGVLLKRAGDIEQVQIAFETMLGSAEAAQQLLEDITSFAAKTPFQLTGLIDNTKKLIAFGIEADEVIDTMTVLGNIAAGVGRDKLPSIVLAFGKIRTKGKATMEELNILLEAGVPVLDALADNLGVTTQELFKLVSAGKVGFEDVNAALTGLATGTGKFAGLMEKQSKSFLGIVSNIIDLIEQLAIEIGNELLPMAKELGKGIIDLLEANKKLIKLKLSAFFKEILKLLISLFKVFKFIFKIVVDLTDVFGGLKFAIKGVIIALAVMSGFQILSSLGNMLLLIQNMVVAMKGLRVATLLTNAALALWPALIGTILIAIGLLVEDLFRFFSGDNSIIGVILDAFQNKFPKAFKIFKTVVSPIVGIIQALAKSLADLTTGNFLDAFARILKPITGLITAVGTGIGSIKETTGEGIRNLLGIQLPEASPAVTGGGGNNTSVSVNAPINVEVPPGTPPELVGEATRLGVADALTKVISDTSRALDNEVEF